MVPVSPDDSILGKLVYKALPADAAQLTDELSCDFLRADTRTSTSSPPPSRARTSMLLLVLSAMQVALAAQGEYERWWAFASVSAWFSVVAIFGIGHGVLVLVSSTCWAPYLLVF